MLALRMLKGVLKVRYLLLGGAVTGGITLRKKYLEWKESLPDLSWMLKYIPNSENVNNFKGSLIGIKDKFKDMEIDPSLVGNGKEKIKNFQDWLNLKLTEAYTVAEQAELQEKYQKMKEWAGEKSPAIQSAKDATVKVLPFLSFKQSRQDRIDALQQELIKLQLKYQKELEQLEKDNQEIKNPKSDI